MSNPRRFFFLLIFYCILGEAVSFAYGKPVSLVLKKENWYAECEGKNSRYSDNKQCIGLSESKLEVLGTHPQELVQFNWDLKSGEWAQAKYFWPGLLDLNRAEIFNISFHGDVFQQAVRIKIMFSDDQKVFYGKEIAVLNPYLKTKNRWLVDLKIRKKELKFFFNTNNKSKSKDIDWSRIKFFYIVVEQPCAKGHSFENAICVGAGKGYLIFDRFIYGPDSSTLPENFLSTIPHYLKKNQGFNNSFSFWDLEHENHDIPWDRFLKNQPYWEGISLVTPGNPKSWAVECDREPYHKIFPYECAGTAHGKLSFIKEGESQKIVWDWNFKKGQWVCLKLPIDKAMDLSSASTFGFSFSGISSLLNRYDLEVYIKDKNDVVYGYVLERNSYSFSPGDLWNIHYTVSVEDFSYQFNIATLRQPLDWKNIKSFFICVKRSRHEKDISGKIGVGPLQFKKGDLLSVRKPKREPPPLGPSDPSVWFGTIFFSDGVSEIEEREYTTIEKIAQTLLIIPDKRVSVEGVSCKGEKSYKKLHQIRANNVVDYLNQNFSIPLNRILVKSEILKNYNKDQRCGKVKIKFTD